MKRLLFPILLLFHVELIWGLKFTHEMQLHQNYEMWWLFDEIYITVKVKAKTSGWVGLGVASKGQMEGADMVIGWVDKDGTKHFHDRHAKGKKTPTIDERQDYELLEMTEENGSTSFTFKRKLVLFGSEDFTITGDTVRVLWAWNDLDPSDDEVVMYHGANRGVRSVYLVDYGEHRSLPLPKQYKTFDMTMDKLNVPNDETAYLCKLFKVPNMGSKKNHLIRVDPVIEKGNEAFVHHILLYQCNGEPDKLKVLPKQGSCKVKNMPETECTTNIIHAWAIGGGNFYMPPHSGLSLNTRGDARFMYLEIHYDNPRRRSDIVDSSGFRLYHTEELRQYDAGYLQFGANAGQRYSQIIPQQQKKFYSYGFCPAQCLEKATWSGMDEIRPKIFASFLHTHVHGTQVIIRLMNETTGKEIRTLDQDLNYDFDFQEVRYLKEPIEIPKGVRLDVECTLQTMDLNEPLLNGLGTNEEMCLAFFLVYPKMSLTGCFSTSLSAWSFGKKNFGWEVNQLNGELIKPVVHEGRTYPAGVDAYKPLLQPSFWEGKEDLVKKFQVEVENEAYSYMCFDNEEMQFSFAHNKPRILRDVDHVGKSTACIQSVNMFFLLFACLFQFCLFNCLHTIN